MPTVYPEGSAVQTGGSVGPVNFWTYRTFRGNVRGRALDISRADGTSWQWGSVRVDFVAQNGVTHMSTTLPRTWGQPSALKAIGSPVTDPYLRLRCSISTEPGGYAGQWSFFKLELTW